MVMYHKYTASEFTPLFYLHTYSSPSPNPKITAQYPVSYSIDIITNSSSLRFNDSLSLATQHKLYDNIQYYYDPYIYNYLTHLLMIPIQLPIPIPIPNLHPALPSSKITSVIKNIAFYIINAKIQSTISTHHI